MTAGRDHEWIEVGLRRWCTGCDAFQVRRAHGEWTPRFGEDCPCSTPRAKRRVNGAEPEPAKAGP
jgi:hypothetical protein